MAHSSRLILCTVLSDWLDTNHLITGAFKRVSHAEKAEVVEQIRAVGNPGFTIWNLDASVRSRRSKNAAKGRAAARNASHEEGMFQTSYYAVEHREATITYHS